MRAFVHESTPPGTPTALRVLSWNLLRRIGARAEDVAGLIRVYQPDLVLLQECTADLAMLPGLVGGHFCRQPMERRIYGLAAWSPEPFAASEALGLPVSVLPGRVPPRLAQLVKFRGIHFANVHLSHGQFLNRWQLLHIAEVLEGPAAIIGDYNAVGATALPGFRDIGPRRRTHRAGNVVALRLDRCLGRGLACQASEVLEKGNSDHHPIVLNLSVAGGLAAATIVPDMLRSFIARRARARKGAQG
ncbi:MAG: endonuclease/exonuclease/phosphatase family protein [Alphaproteobacteria bacterium]|nr:endonuclease/exonuclease/phosphatase family protein [Alphaproteobacteria bacterium]